MHGVKRSFLPLVVILLLLAVSPARALIVETGSLSSEIARLKTLVFPRDSGLYVVPTQQNLTDFSTMVTSVKNGSYTLASTQAAALGYDLVHFYDTDTSHEFYLLREILNAQGKQTTGWGNYVWNPNPVKDILVEAPHPLYDTNTPEFAIDVFEGLYAKGYLMAGAHRAANYDGIYGIANVVGNTSNVFHIVHMAWSQATTLPIQIHGFAYSNHTNFPAGTDVVMSNCDGAVLQPHIDLDKAFDSAGLLSFCYNTLSLNDPTNVLVNTDWLNGGVVSGGTFSGLSGTYNTQSAYTRNTYGAPFVHCELEQSIRFKDPTLWDPAVNAIVYTFIPEPATVLLLIAGALGVLARARRK